jgi:hypothetical protein
MLFMMIFGKMFPFGKLQRTVRPANRELSRPSPPVHAREQLQNLRRDIPWFT